jgi:hypothetical protein
MAYTIGAPQPPTPPRGAAVSQRRQTRTICLVVDSRLTEDGPSVKLLLAFISIVIPSFSLLEFHDQDFYSLLDTYVVRKGACSKTKALRLLHRSFSTRISGLSRRPGHYGLCVTALY